MASTVVERLGGKGFESGSRSGYDQKAGQPFLTPSTTTAPMLKLSLSCSIDAAAVEKAKSPR